MSGKREGWRTLTPRLVTEDVAGLVGFLNAVFGADGTCDPGRPAELTIGDSMVMVSDGGGLRTAGGGFLHVYVEDVDATLERARAFPIEIVEPASDMPYGDRRATIRDGWGNLWQIAAQR